MSRRPLIFAALVAAAFPLVAAGQAESEFYATPKTAPEFWRVIRFEIRLGNYERAAERVKGLLDLNPDDKTLVDLVDKPPAGVEGGMAPFLRLRNVPRWNSDDKKDKAAKADVETLITKLGKALETELSNPERIRRFANALAGTPEEAVFALREIRRGGKSAAPVLAQMLIEKPAEELRAGIIGILPELDGATVPPFIAFLGGADPQSQLDVMDALRKRADYRNSVLAADTDPVPTLWYLWGNPESSASVKQKAREGLISAIRVDPESIDRSGDLKSAQGQLAAGARRFYTETANLPKLPGDEQGNAVHSVWTWDGKALKEAKVNRAAATEHYGLRYARWALELQPDYAVAQNLFLGLAIEGHAVRAGGAGALAKTAPELYAALATAPFEILAELLEEALREKKTAVALAVTRVIGERTEPKAARPTSPASAKTPRPALLVKALDYPDARVQFAAADALLRSPGPATHGRNAQIVKILAAALAADPGPEGKQKALLGDPDGIRSEAVAALLRRAGFEVDMVRSGRDLMRRLHEKADIDLLVIDRHLPDPLIGDLLPQLRADRRAKTLPLLLVASSDGITPVNLFTALARLAAVIAFEDLPGNPYFDYSPNRKDESDRVRKSPEETQQDVLSRHAAQVKRMTELVEKAGFTVSDVLHNRIVYLSIQTFAPETLTAFVPQLVAEERLAVDRLLSPAARIEFEGSPVSVKKPRMRADTLPSLEEAQRIVEVMRLTANEERAIRQERLQALAKLWDLMWDPAAPKLPPAEPTRYPDIEARLARVAGPYRNIRVVPAVFTDDGFKSELIQATDPKAPLGTPAEKKEMAKAAMGWLRKMAVGEIVGYPIADAIGAIRSALKSDELAPLAVDALVKLSTREGQQDLSNLATDAGRPIPLRSQAADALVKHIQTFGKFVTGPQADSIAASALAADDAELKARLLAVQGVLTSTIKGTTDRLKGYQPKPVEAKDAAPPKEDPKEEKKDQ